jgi:hypothetical protein
MNFERGFLSKPAVKRLLASQEVDTAIQADADDLDEAARIAAQNDEVYTTAIRRWFKETEPMR